MIASSVARRPDAAALAPPAAGNPSLEFAKVRAEQGLELEEEEQD